MQLNLSIGSKEIILFVDLKSTYMLLYDFIGNEIMLHTNPEDLLGMHNSKFAELS